MGYTWTEDLATAVQEIDDQHKELFSRFNALLEACMQRKGKGEIAQYLRFLEEYIVEHFSAEEKRMTELGYSGLSSHRAEHGEFIKQIAEIREEYQEYGAAINVVLMALRASGDWLVSHIRRTDRAMAAYLRSAGAR